MRQNFYPRGQRARQAQRQRLMNFLKLSVDSVAHAQRFFERLKVQIRRPKIYCEPEEQFHKLDNRPRGAAREVVSRHVNQFAQLLVEVFHKISPLKNFYPRGQRKPDARRFIANLKSNSTSSTIACEVLPAKLCRAM